MNNKRLPLIIDIVFCAVLMPVMVMLLPIERWIASSPVSSFLFIVFLYGTYFINRYVAVPMLLGKRNYLVGIGILVLTIFVAFSLINVRPHPHAHYMKNFDTFRFMPPMRVREQGMLFLFFVVTCFSYAVGFFSELIKQISKSTELEKQRDKAELSLYKAQINPHFLFNTLNSLYGLIVTGSEKSETAFMQFIDMLKYMYSNGDRDRLPVREEVEYIRRYIEMQKLRLNEHTAIDFECVNTVAEERTIASMLLITFVENAFKYGVSSHEDSVIKIRIEVSDNVLHFYSSNRVMRVSEGKGMGLKNCRKRLDMLYAKDYRLDITEKDNTFTVELDINLENKKP